MDFKLINTNVKKDGKHYCSLSLALDRGSDNNDIKGYITRLDKIKNYLSEKGIKESSLMVSLIPVVEELIKTKQI